LIDTFLREKYLYWLEALSLLKNVSEGVTSMLGLDRLLEVSSLQCALRVMLMFCQIGKDGLLLVDRVRDGYRFILYFK